MGAFYYNISLFIAVILALVLREYLVYFGILAVVLLVLSHFHKKGWIRREYTIILYDEHHDEIIRFPKIKAWGPQKAYQSVMKEKTHMFWDFEVTREEG